MAQSRTISKTTTKRRTSGKTMKKAATSRKTKPTTKRGRAPSSSPVGDKEVTMDRRRKAGRRGEELEGMESASAPSPKLERRQKVNRRRQIDPTTCERDYTENEVEFMNALDDYKRKSGRMFPTCSEVLEVIHALGYIKFSPAELGGMPAAAPCGASAKPMPTDWSSSTLPDKPAEQEASNE